MEKNEEGTLGYTNGLSHDWRKRVDISKPSADNKDKLLSMLDELQSPWDGHLSPINVAKRRHEIMSPNIRPIHYLHNELDTRQEEYGWTI